MSQRWVAGRRMRALLMGMVMAAALSACGGGGSGSSASNPPAPPAPTLPVAQIGTIKPEAPTTATELTFEAGSQDAANTYAWSFGDGNSAFGLLVTHRYTAPGSYVVTLAVTGRQGLKNMASATVAVTLVPISAALTPLPNTKLRLGDPVDFGGVGTGEGALRFRWEVDGRLAGEGPLNQFRVSFNTTGSHTVALTVVDSLGRTSTTSTTVSVGAALPSAAIVPRAGQGIVGRQEYFQARESTYVTRYSWNFGDGTPDVAGVEASHTYASSGRFPVTLTTWNADGEQASATMTMDVHHPPPSVWITQAFNTPLVAAAGQTQVFTARVQGASPMQYRWRFSDGGTASSVDAQHIFEQPGAHEITLEVTDSHGEKANASLTVQVGEARFELLPGADRMPALQAGRGPQALVEASSRPLLCLADGSVLLLNGAVYKLDPQRRVLPFAGAIGAVVQSPESGVIDGSRSMGTPFFIVRAPDGVPYVQDVDSVWRLAGPVATRAPLDLQTRRMDAVDGQGRVWHRNLLSSSRTDQGWRYDPATGKQELMLTGPVLTEGDVGPAMPYFDHLGAMAFSPRGDLYFVERFGGPIAVRRMTSDGRLQAVGIVNGSAITQYSWSSILDVDASGTVFYMDQGPRLHVLRDGTHRIIPIGSGTPSPQISACPHPSGRAQQVAVSLDEGEFMVDVERGTVTKIRGHASDFANPTGAYQLIGADAQGQAFAINGTALARIDNQGRFQPWVGDAVVKGDADGVGAEARFAGLWRGAVTPQGEVWGLDYAESLGVRLRHVDATGKVRSLPERYGDVQVLTTNAAGDAILVGDTRVQIVTRDGARTERPLPGGFRIEQAVMNRDGVLYFKFGCGIYQQPPTGPVTLLAGDAGEFGDCRFTGFPLRDGTGREVSFGPMAAMAIDPQGQVYVIDGPAVRSISPTGQVRTLASIYLRLPDETGAPLVEAILHPNIMVPLPTGEMLFQAQGLLIKSTGLGLKPAP